MSFDPVRTEQIRADTVAGELARMLAADIRFAAQHLDLPANYAGPPIADTRYTRLTKRLAETWLAGLEEEAEL